MAWKSRDGPVVEILAKDVSTRGGEGAAARGGSKSEQAPHSGIVEGWDLDGEDGSDVGGSVKERLHGTHRLAKRP
ncbi:hypothetical protein NDU88_003189 [Pleurodeles waltl]|uniref:Uncharacterized protein n=1 Tax=Pleurodeles waltl TaxID=8319 RepID=A0AAV7UXR9_PLEWA|nr:hypothetical protein NDU88_003189 [Pleurodeles waltl]